MFRLTSIATAIFIALIFSSSCTRKATLNGDSSSAPKLNKTQRIKVAELSRLDADVGDLKAGDKLYATFKTSMGDMKVELYWEDAPLTVANFVGLAKGSKAWLNPKTNKESHESLYKGSIFHRVIPGFMIQGGDPLGTGMGGPGYSFKDEFSPKLRHNAAGILSMANSGPNSNGSQFFITEGPTPHLDHRHSIFGKVIENVALIEKIAQVSRGVNDRPVKDVVINEIIIAKN